MNTIIILLLSLLIKNNTTTSIIVITINHHVKELGLKDCALAPPADWAQNLQSQTQRVQSTYMVQSMVSVVVISLMVWASIPHMGT